MPNRSFPHIVLVIMDSVGAKHCSVYGHGRETTPGLSRIAEEAMVYQRCFAPSSWTLPSHVSLFSGLNPSQHGCTTHNLTYPGNYYVLPEVLQSLGYYTIGISSNLLISRPCNFNWGFHEFHDMDTLFNTNRYSQMREAIKSERDNYSGTLEEMICIVKKSYQEKYLSYPIQHLFDRIYRKLWGDVVKKSSFFTERSFRLAKNLIKQHRDKNLFFFINFMEAHDKYKPPKGYNNILHQYRDKAPISELLYEQEIAYLDERLYDFYNFLKELGLDEDTLLIITADHGEGFGEHGHQGHVFCLYNEIIHVPLVVKYPAAFGLQGSSDRLVQLQDLFATLMEVAASPLPVPESSSSLLGPARDLVLAENLDVAFAVNKFISRSASPQPFMQPCRCAIDADLFKLIEWLDGRLELFDLNRDFGETHDLAQVPELAPRVATLQRVLAEKLGPFGKNA